VRLLLDTQCWLWLQVTPERLSGPTIDLFSDPDSELYLSAASAWEVAIKYALGKLPLPLPPDEYVRTRMELSGTLPLSIEHRHALHVAGLPLHHRDPFDRLLVAQAQLEELKLVTSDRQLAAYDVEVLWA
jgi:PIN domain nuclease of toxin-antitoxin system